MKQNDQYSAQETEARIQAALRDARLAGPKPKVSMTPKRPKAQRKARKKT